MQLVRKSHEHFIVGRAPRVGYLSDEQMDKYYVDFFNRKDIDGWDLRQGLNELQVRILCSLLFGLS